MTFVPTQKKSHFNQLFAFFTSQFDEVSLTLIKNYKIQFC